MPEQRSRRAGEPGRRPAAVRRDGRPRKEIAYWLRLWLEDHGDPTIEEIVRGLPDSSRLSPSAVGKALKGETFPGAPLLIGILSTRGASEDEIQNWLNYRSYLEYLDYYRDDDCGPAKPPKWLRDVDRETPSVESKKEDRDDGVPVETSNYGQKRPLAQGAVGVIIGVGLAIVGVTSYQSLAASLADSGGRSPSATVISPDTTVVPRTFQLAGSYRDLPANTLIWVSTFNPANRRFYPQDKPCVALPNDTFNCGQYYVGEQNRPDTATYTLDVMVADASASNMLLQYQIDKGGPTGPDPGLKSLPQGATVIFSRDVTRGP